MWVRISKERSPRPSPNCAPKLRRAGGTRRPPHLVLRTVSRTHSPGPSTHSTRARARTVLLLSNRRLKGVCIISPLPRTRPLSRRSCLHPPIASSLPFPGVAFSHPCGVRRLFDLPNIQHVPWRNGDIVINRAWFGGELRASEMRWRHAVIDTNGSLFIPATYCTGTRSMHSLHPRHPPPPSPCQWPHHSPYTVLSGWIWNIASYTRTTSFVTM